MKVTHSLSIKQHLSCMTVDIWRSNAANILHHLLSLCSCIVSLVVTVWWHNQTFKNSPRVERNPLKMHTHFAQCVFPSFPSFNLQELQRQRETTSATELSVSWSSCPKFHHQSSVWRLNGVTEDRKLRCWMVSHSSFFMPDQVVSRHIVL